MSEINQKVLHEDAEQLYGFIASEMRAGSDKQAIARKLEDQGVGRHDAENLTTRIYSEIAEVVEKEQYSGAALVPGLLGGLLGALIGGGVWAGILILTNYEVGFIAWGIGALCGMSIVGILIGKYLTLYYYLTESVMTGTDEGDLAEVSLFSFDFALAFAEILPQMASIYDALWVFLAVVTAWQIPRSSGIDLKSSQPRGPITPS